MSSIYREVENGESYIINVKKTADRSACCDCGLVHDIVYEIVNKDIIRITNFRNNGATGQVRRHMKEKKT